MAKVGKISYKSLLVCLAIFFSLLFYLMLPTKVKAGGPAPHCDCPKGNNDCRYYTTNCGTGCRASSYYCSDCQCHITCTCSCDGPGCSWGDWRACVNGYTTRYCSCNTTIYQISKCTSAYCGDGNCNTGAGESCSSCPKDCGPCCTPSCPLNCGEADSCGIAARIMLTARASGLECAGKKIHPCPLPAGHVQW